VDARATAVEINLSEWVVAQGESLPDVEVHREVDVSWIYSDSGVPGNTITLARFCEETAAERCRTILDYHLRRFASSHWILGPASQPENLSGILRGLGYSCRIHCAGMVCESVPATVPAAKDVRVELVSERPLFEPLTTARRKRAKALADGMASRVPQRIWYFGAWFDGKVVGRTTLFAGSETAGIYDVEVVKHARHRGIGTMLVHAALEQAFALGFRTTVLAATGAGQGVYERCGFREVAKISFWMYGRMRQAR
jgi:GNAT superfamily N-acetyltransferase